MKKLFAAIALLMTMAACTGTADKALETTTWKLTRMQGIPAESINRNADFFTMEFNAAEMMVAGVTNCNRFFGKYELTGKKLEFGSMGMTRMACPDMEYENAFTRMLDEVDSYSIKGSELTLYDDGQVLAVFKAVERSASAQ